MPNINIFKEAYLFKDIKKTRIFLFLSCTIAFQIYSQKITIKGSVKDSLNTPLEYANVLAEPVKDFQMEFAITEKNGSFSLDLVKTQDYFLRVSYLGYKTKALKINASKDTIINFILMQDDNLLDEIKINTKLAVSIKKDTITYLVNKFTTGEERKLRDVLKKLPGIEVDKEGNVFSQGKRVTKVLVENKQFFTGDSKLAVNNIPADAVNEVELLDNYNEVAILKGLENSDDLAMNIKLKKDKKKFWFGDVEVGIGVKDRKVIHPSLFYYSPKKSINFIGDLNNTGTKSFTFKDYLDFEGGYSKILLNPKAYFTRLNDDFSQFLSNTNFKNSNHTFGGFNITASINQNTDLIGYTIYSKSENELENQLNNTYINNASSFNETRIQRQNPNNQFIINKLTIDNTQEDGTKLKFTSFFKYANNVSDNKTTSVINNKSNEILNIANAENYNFRQDLEFYKTLTSSQTITFLSNYSYSKGNTNTNWISTNNVFQPLIPVLDDTNYSLFNDKNTLSQNASSLLKHYWVLDDFLHLYTTVGLDIYLDKLATDEYQQLSDLSINNFNSSNFGNDIEFKFLNSYIGSNLKFQKGKIIFNTGIFYHNYLRNTIQIDKKNQLDKKYVLPEVSINYDIQRSQKINFKYNLKVRFPSIARLLNNYTLTNFNSIFRGNVDLENELYHQLSLYYYNFSLSKKINYNVSATYRKTAEGIQNINVLEGINFISEPILIKNADENILINASVSKNYGDFKLSINSNNSFSNYLQILNSELQRNISKSQTLGGSIKSNFKNFPNFEVLYNKSFDNFKTPSSSSNFENQNFEINIEYDFLNDFIFKSDFTQQKFTNKSQNSGNRTNFFNASLYYQKENSLWGFELSANNIFNNQFIRNSSFSDFLISDNKTFLLSRIIMLKVSYKLD